MSPGLSFDGLRARFKSIVKHPRVRLCTAFWLFGLINNILYVILITAALDLVGPAVPKGVVLLANVFPSFMTKLIAPYFIQEVSYGTRIIIVVAGLVLGMLLIVLTPEARDAGSLTVKMCAVAICSMVSGIGELSFLALTHYYGHLSLASWGSGTGAAGLIGAGAYVFATSIIGLSVRVTLAISAVLPFTMLVTYYLILPHEQMQKTAKTGYTSVASDELDTDNHDANDVHSPERAPAARQDSDEFGHASLSSGRTFPSFSVKGTSNSLGDKLKRARTLVVPYMVPLFLVYLSEYTINQGVAPTLLFPLDEGPFKKYREFYPAYSAIYQLGVFISRTSIAFFRIHHLYLPSLLQFGNLCLLTLHSILYFIPSVWIIFAITFWEGLLGGLVYVSTFAEITDNVPSDEREFALSATTASESAGVCVAGVLGMGLEVWLCRWNVRQGRPWCKEE